MDTITETETPHDYLSVKEAARRLGVSEGIIRIWLKSNTHNLRTRTTEKRVEVAEQDITRLMQERGISLGSYDLVDRMQARIDELERNYADLQAKYDALIKAQGQLAELPEGSIALSDFAKLYGVGVSTAKYHASIGFRNASGGHDKLEALRYQRTGEPSARYFLSPDQQIAALQYWKEHHVTFADLSDSDIMSMWRHDPMPVVNKSV